MKNGSTGKPRTQNSKLKNRKPRKLKNCKTRKFKTLKTRKLKIKILKKKI